MRPSMCWNLAAAANLFAGFFAAVLYVFFYYFTPYEKPGMAAA